MQWLLGYSLSEVACPGCHLAQRLQSIASIARLAKVEHVLPHDQWAIQEKHLSAFHVHVHAYWSLGGS